MFNFIENKFCANPQYTSSLHFNGRWAHVAPGHPPHNTKQDRPTSGVFLWQRAQVVGCPCLEEVLRGVGTEELGSWGSVDGNLSLWVSFGVS